MQPDLFSVTAYDKWEKFHRQNPDIWQLFARFAFAAINSGKKHYSARAIMERIRWQTEIVTKGSVFKMNNNHVPMYARLFMSAYPEHAGFFKTKGEQKLAA